MVVARQNQIGGMVSLGENESARVERFKLLTKSDFSGRGQGFLSRRAKLVKYRQTTADIQMPGLRFRD